MGTNTDAGKAAGVAVNQTDPSDIYGNDKTGIVAELRVISFLLAEGLSLNVDLDALRNQFTRYKS